MEEAQGPRRVEFNGDLQIVELTWSGEMDSQSALVNFGDIHLEGTLTAIYVPSG